MRIFAKRSCLSTKAVNVLRKYGWMGTMLKNMTKMVYSQVGLALLRQLAFLCKGWGRRSLDKPQRIKKNCINKFENSTFDKKFSMHQQIFNFQHELTKIY